jgi:glutaredoxin
MKKTIKLLTVLVLMAILMPFNINAQVKTNVYVFYGRECPHCKNEQKFLESIKEEYNLEIYYYETWHNAKNQDMLKKVKQLYNIDDFTVPYTVIGDEQFTGYAEYMDNDIKAMINKYDGDDSRLLPLIKDGVRSDVDTAIKEEANNATAIIIFFGVIVGGLIFLMKPEKKKRG